MQLPTVCVSSLADPLQQQFATTTLNLLAAATTAQSDSPLVSPVFVDTACNVSFEIPDFKLPIILVRKSAHISFDKWRSHQRNAAH
jgi:hypothetical protein